MNDADRPEALNRGLNLYRSGQYWDAHEEWEDLWQSLPTNSAARRATQALIQLAAICHKPEQAASGRSEKDMQTGMKRLLTTARAHLEASFELPSPTPEWDRDALHQTLGIMAEIRRDWVGGEDLTQIRDRVAEAAAAFTL